MAVVLALLSATAYGIADYVGGVVAGKASPWQVATVVMLSALVGSIPVALIAGGSPTGSDWLLAAGGGLMTGAGSGFLYRGLMRGRMAVVAPLSGVMAAVVPVVIGIATGDRPTALALIGIVCALPAIALVAGAGSGVDDGGTESANGETIGNGRTESGAGQTIGTGGTESDGGETIGKGGTESDGGETISGAPPSEPASAAVIDGLLAGTGFGLLFAATGSLSDDAGLAVLPLLELSGVVGVILLAAVLRVQWVPRERAAWQGWIGGVLGLAAVVLVTIAGRSGLTSIVSVIASLYPAVTVLMAAVLLGERIARLQGVGLALAAAAVALVVLG